MSCRECRLCNREIHGFISGRVARAMGNLPSRLTGLPPTSPLCSGCAGAVGASRRPAATASFWGGCPRRCAAGATSRTFTSAGSAGPGSFASLHLHAATYQRPDRRPQADFRRRAHTEEVTPRQWQCGAITATPKQLQACSEHVPTMFLACFEPPLRFPLPAPNRPPPTAALQFTITGSIVKLIQELPV